MKRSRASHKVRFSPLITPKNCSPYHHSTYNPSWSLPDRLRLTQEVHPTKINLLDYHLGQVIEISDLSLDDCLSYLNSPSVSWFDVMGLGNMEILNQIGEIFQLDAYLLEDIISVPRRPKVEEFSEILSIITQMVVIQPHQNRFALEQVSIILGKNFVITFQEESSHDCFEVIRDNIRKNKGRIPSMGADYLAYALWDSIIDGYHSVIEFFREQVSLLEEEILFHPRLSTLETIYRTKKDLMVLYRGIYPQRNALEVLIRDNKDFFGKKVCSGLRDCHDHTQQAIDSIESNNSLLEGLISLYLSSISNQTNETMKVLTVVSSIFIPLTFIAGIYGMNFDPDTSPFNMPELDWYWGYPVCLLLMLTIALVLLSYFWKRGWFKQKVPRDFYDN
jgi:magnesium transporter